MKFKEPALRSLAPLIITCLEGYSSNTREDIEIFFDNYHWNNNTYYSDPLELENYTLYRLRIVNDDNKLKELLLDLIDNRILASKDEENIIQCMQDILYPEYYYVEKIMNNYKIFGDDISEYSFQSITHFKDNKQEIIKQINNAKYCIWIIMYHLTDKYILDALHEKQKSGLNVQILLSSTSDTTGLNFSTFDTFIKIPTWGNLNHNSEHRKICIIDCETVLHGSFNWTPTASYNNEELTIDKGFIKAREYCDEFIRTKKKYLSLNQA